MLPCISPAACSTISSFGPLFLSSPVPACYNCSSFQTSSSLDFLKQFLGHHAGVALACPCLSFPSFLTASFGGILLIVLLGVNTSVSTTRLYFLFFLNVHLGTGPELGIYYTLYHSFTQQSFLCFGVHTGVGRILVPQPGIKLHLHWIFQLLALEAQSSLLHCQGCLDCVFSEGKDRLLASSGSNWDLSCSERNPADMK